MQKFKTSIQIKKANKYHTYGAQQDPLVAYRVLACLVYLEELWQQVDPLVPLFPMQLATFLVVIIAPGSFSFRSSSMIVLSMITTYVII